MNINVIFRKLILDLLSVSLAATVLSGCGTTSNNELTEENASTSVTEQNNDSKHTADSENIDQSSLNESFGPISLEWEDYKGDLETFVYGLLINQLRYEYDTFQAYVDLPDGVTVCGIAYTDYEECYTDEEEKEYFFQACSTQ